MCALHDRALDLDRNDALAPFRDRFAIDDDLIYLDGNSLGRPPRSALPAVSEVARSEWASELVMGWDHWLGLGAEAGDELAPIIGATKGEVLLCDQTSVNLYKLAVAAVDATRRPRILTDAGNFPSDIYVLDAVARSAGGELEVMPEDPGPDVIAAHLDESVGLVALTHVNYRTGRMYDGASITALAHDNGSLMLWDLAHSAGAVPVDLHAWNSDLAVGCTYKYLNGGPGAPGFVHVRSDLHASLNQPIAGWFGHRDQFGFATDFVPADSITRFLVGTPPILSLAAAREGVRLTAEAGMEPIRFKSLNLTSLFMEAIAEFAANHDIENVTPTDSSKRGSHVALRHEHGYQLSAALRDEGVIVDFRAPDLVRFGFAPLYNTHRQAVDAAGTVRKILDAASWHTFPPLRSGVT